MDVRRLVVCVMSLVSAFCLFCFSAGAEAGSGSIEDEQSRIFAEMGEIAEDVAENGGSSAGASVWGESAADAGQAITDLLEPERVFEELADIARVALPEAVSLLCAIAGLIIISAVCRQLCDGFAGGAISSGVGFVSAAAVISAILALQLNHFDMAERFFDSLGSLMESMIPVTGMVWAMGGNVTTASVGTVTLYAMLAVTQKICAATVLPVCYVTGMTAVCSGLCDGAMLGGFSGAVKKVYNFFIGLIMTVLVFVLGAQTTIAVSADTAAARGAKLLTGTVIPVVGGAVGDTLRTVAGSVQYIKSVVGVGGIILALALTLPTLISLLLFRLVFILTSGFADMLGCKTEGRLLSELGNVYGCLVGAVAICSVAFVIALGIFVRCTVAAA